MRLTTGVSSGFERSPTVADEATVRAEVDSWLGDVLANRAAQADGRDDGAGKRANTERHDRQ